MAESVDETFEDGGDIHTIGVKHGAICLDAFCCLLILSLGSEFTTNPVQSACGFNVVPSSTRPGQAWKHSNSLRSERTI
eukprot:2438943-Amphidinium_carterae.1